MNRLIIVVAIAIVIVIAGLIIFFWDGDPPPPPPPPPPPEEPPGTDDNSSEVQPDPPPPVTGTVSVSINAIPWARVFIKLPENNYFIVPRARDFTIPPASDGENANVTPIPGDLKVPIGTTIKLTYREKEKIFPYEVWKDEKTIWHDFLNQ